MTLQIKIYGSSQGQYLPMAGLTGNFLTRLFYQGHYLVFTLRPYLSIVAIVTIYGGGLLLIFQPNYFIKVTIYPYPKNLAEVI